MKWVLSSVLVIALAGPAKAEPGITGRGVLRLATAASDACQANCSTTAAQCKRVCPAVFATPCLASCDNQYLTCQRGCQSK